MTIQDYLTRLEGVPQTASGFSARCPAHSDHNASLSVAAGEDGRILVHCHAGCSTEDIVAAMGLTMGDLFPDEQRPSSPSPARGGAARGQIVARYPYYSKDGAPLIQVVRFEPKSFMRQRPDGNGGWINGGTGDVVALYKWPELARACAAHGKAYLVEGEKDVETLIGCGATATTCLGGASKWREEYADEFVGLSSLVIIADRDTEHNGFAGQKFADKALKAIRAKGVPVKALVLPGEVGGDKIKDVSDFLQHGRTLADLEAAVAAAPEWDSYFSSTVPASAQGQSQTLMESIWAHVTDRERPQMTEVTAAISQWLGEHGQFFNVSGALNYYSNDEQRYFDTISREWVSWLFRQITDFGQTSAIGREIIAAFSKHPLALAAPDTIKVESRHFWDATDDAIYISNGPKTMYKITPESIDILGLGADGIYMQSTLEPWTLVEKGGELDPLDLEVFKSMGCTEAERKLIMLWAYALPFVQRRKPILLFHGEIGSGKTFAAQSLIDLFGLPALTFAPTRRNEDAFDVFMGKGGIGIVDNVDDAIPWLGNSLDVASTGSGTTRRILYTTNETLTVKPLTGLILTSADATFAGRSSTADRILSVEFVRGERIAKDAALTTPIIRNRDRLMSFIARAIQGALRQPVPADGINKRHPDFGLIAQRLGLALGWKDVPRILHMVEDRKELLAFENDTKYLGPLYDFMVAQTKEWKGTAKQLLEAMIDDSCYSENEKRNVYPSAFGKRLSKAWRTIEKLFHASRRDLGHRRMEYTFPPLYPATESEAEPEQTEIIPPPPPPPPPIPKSVEVPLYSGIEAAPQKRRYDFDLVKHPIMPWRPEDALAEPESER